MTKKDLLEILENFDDDEEVVIGMRQTYGTDFAMEISYDIEMRKVRAFWGDDYKAIVITEGEQCGSVVYDGDEDEEEWEEDEEE